MNTRSALRVLALAGVALASTASARHAAIPPAATLQAADEELTTGQETFSELRVRSEIIDSSPLYDFKSNPDVFGRFDSDRQSATPFEAPKRAPVVFLR